MTHFILPLCSLNNIAKQESVEFCIMLIGAELMKDLNNLTIGMKVTYPRIIDPRVGSSKWNQWIINSNAGIKNLKKRSDYKGDGTDHSKIILTSFFKSTSKKLRGRHHQLYSHARMRSSTCTFIGIYINIHCMVGSCLVQNINMSFSTIHNAE